VFEIAAAVVCCWCLLCCVVCCVVVCFLSLVGLL